MRNCVDSLIFHKASLRPGNASLGPLDDKLGELVHGSSAFGKEW